MLSNNHASLAVKIFAHFISLLIGITIEFLQMDELWSYLKNKKRQLWVFIALESKTKFWVNFELGSRTNHTANRLVENLKGLCRWNSGHLLKITTDKERCLQKCFI